MFLFTWQLIVPSFLFTIRHLWHAHATTLPVGRYNFYPILSAIHQFRLLMWYLLNSVCSLLISQRNCPNRLLSLGNLRMLFNSLPTRSLYNLHSSPRFLATLPFQRFSASSGVESAQARSSSKWSSRSFDQQSHLSLNSFVQSKYVADSRLQEIVLSPLQLPQSTQQSSSGPQSLFVFPPSYSQPRMPRLLLIFLGPRHLARFRLLWNLPTLS